MKQTRLRISIGIIIYLALVGFVALMLGYPNVTMFCIGGITGSGLMYKYGETKRPSSK